MVELFEEVAQQAATGDMARLYLDIRRTLRVPIVNLLYRVWATEGRALELLWGVARPNLQTIDFEAKADSLRCEAVEKITYDVEVPSELPRIGNLKLAAADVAQLRRELDLFHYVNSKLLLHCALLKKALGWRGYAGTGRAIGAIELGIAPHMPKEIVLVDAQSAAPDVRSLLEKIRSRLNLAVLKDRKSTRLNSSHSRASRMPSSA